MQCSYIITHLPKHKAVVQFVMFDKMKYQVILLEYLFPSGFNITQTKMFPEKKCKVNKIKIPHGSYTSGQNTLNQPMIKTTDLDLQTLHIACTVKPASMDHQ